ncbi:hypothetical protein GUJ93_ZPchr0001g30905 [Zizania palustris]|uniref:Uncharacterized protein n=1 Tax=Zizania palustris TaxID=103762 RepID=A0A8J5RNN0_ZIZPA|nr:hypothetical protein GUJ93_ZPchr0001g30905 [Zizania palustris]
MRPIIPKPNGWSHRPWGPAQNIFNNKVDAQSTTRCHPFRLSYPRLEGRAAFISLAPLPEHPCPVGQKYAGPDGGAPDRNMKSEEACSPSAKKAKKRAVTLPSHRATQSAS